MKELSETDKAFNQGMAAAAAIIVQIWGEETQAEELLCTASLTTVKALRESGVDWYDIRALVPVLKTVRDRDRAVAHRRTVEAARSAYVSVLEAGK